MTNKPTIKDSLLLCASDLQHSAIYDNHIEMQSCIRAVADRITALASVIDGVGRAALAAPAQPAAQALDAARVFWQQHTQADALSMTMAELHTDVELVIRAARVAAQAGENEFVSRAGWVESAMRVYLIAGDTEKEARECAEYLCGEQDMDDLEDPIAAAMEDCEGRGAAQAAPVDAAVLRDAERWMKLEAEAVRGYVGFNDIWYGSAEDLRHGVDQLPATYTDRAARERNK